MKPKAGLPPHTSTVLDVPLAVSTRVVVGTDTRGHATHVARAETVLFSAGVSHTWLTTMFPTFAPRGRRAVSSLLVVAGDGGGCERKRGRGAARGGLALAALRATGCGSDAEW